MPDQDFEQFLPPPSSFLFLCFGESVEVLFFDAERRSWGLFFLPFLYRASFGYAGDAPFRVACLTFLVSNNSPYLGLSGGWPPPFWRFRVSVQASVF